MKTYKTKLSTLQFIAILGMMYVLSSCKKDKNEPQVVFPLNLKVVSITQKTAIRVFQNGKEVPASQTNFDFSSESIFDYASTEIGEDDKITFSSANSVSFGNQKFSVVRNGDLFLFNAEQWNMPADANSILYKMIKYKNAPMAIPVAQNGIAYLTNEVRVARGNFDNMQISVLCYFFSRDESDRGSYRSSGVFFNELEENSITSVAADETLAVQEFLVKLAK